MDALAQFSSLKIESFTTAMRYGMRDDFASCRQDLIDTIRSETIAVLRRAAKPGSLEVSVDDDGDLLFDYKHSSFAFRLDVRPAFAGTQFQDVYEHPLAMDVIKCFYTQLVQVLGLRDVDVFSLDFKNVLNIQKGEPKNFALFQRSLMPALHENLSPLVAEGTEPARIDFKIGWDYDKRRTCYCTIECPANDENTTVWTALNLRTRDDIVASVNQSEFLEDVDMAYHVYCSPYGETIRRMLVGVELDLERRQLVRR